MIYGNLVFFRICAVCGSLDWDEYIDYAILSFTTDEDGDTIDFNESYGDTVDIRCHYCEKATTHELSVDKSYWKRIHDMNDENRLIYIIKLMSQKKMRLNKNFVDDVVFYHENDKKFMKRISKYLQILGYTAITG